MDWQEAIKEKAKCCACEQPLSQSEHLNLMDLFKRAAWSYPVACNMLIPSDIGHAVALLCDGCIESGREALFAIETRNGGQEILYHPVAELEDLPERIQAAYQALQEREARRQSSVFN